MTLDKLKNIVDGFLRKRYREVVVEKIQTERSELLKGRVALITGASGGLGYGIAAAFISGGGERCHHWTR